MTKIIILFLLTLNLVLASVGKLTAIRGDVTVLRETAQMSAFVGMKLEEKDEIITKKASKAQMIFNDKTVITIGKNSSFSIKEYLYEPTSTKSKAKFGASRGFFKAITGAIGKINPDKFSIATKTSTIGIRGTHFFGMMDETSERIGCTQGAIVVEANGVSVDVLAGEITIFNLGDVPTPARQIEAKDLNQLRGGLASRSEISSKIAQLKLKLDGGKITFDKEKVGEILESIRSIKDNDIRTAAADELQDKLVVDLDKLAEKISNKIDIDVSSGYSVADGHNALKWGFYTEKPIEKEEDGYSVDGNKYSTLNEAIVAAVPDDLWREAVQSNETVIEELIGKSSDGALFKHYDGLAERKEVVQYVGKVLGFVSADNVYNLIEQDSTNRVILTHEFGNRFYSGLMQFNAKNPNANDLTKWSVALSSADATSITPTSFNAPVFIPFGSTKLSGANLFFNRYYGDEANQISGYFRLNDTSENEAYGIFTANRGDKTGEGSAYSLVGVPIKKGEYFSWGYWAIEQNIQGTEVDVASLSGGWIKPNDGIEKTALAQMEDYKLTQLKASYSGEVVGTVQDILVGNDVMKNGNIALDFDFAKSSATGSLSFDSHSEAWKIGIDEAQIEGNGFSLTQMSAQSGSDVELARFSGDGSFYGNSAEAIGGGFKLTSTTGKSAIGAFVGNK